MNILSNERAARIENASLHTKQKIIEMCECENTLTNRKLNYRDDSSILDSQKSKQCLDN